MGLRKDLIIRLMSTSREFSRLWKKLFPKYEIVTREEIERTQNSIGSGKINGLLLPALLTEMVTSGKWFELKNFEQAKRMMPGTSSHDHVFFLSVREMKTELRGLKDGLYLYNMGERERLDSSAMFNIPIRDVSILDVERCIPIVEAGNAGDMIYLDYRFGKDNPFVGATDYSSGCTHYKVADSFGEFLHLLEQPIK